MQNAYYYSYLVVNKIGIYQQILRKSIRYLELLHAGAQTICMPVLQLFIVYVPIAGNCRPILWWAIPHNFKSQNLPLIQLDGNNHVLLGT
jgi:hypothetical protein